jgi:hypothetical protein
MNLLATHLVLLAQGYDSTGGASRFSIVIGALAFPCLIIIAVIWQKLKNAKQNDKHSEELQRKVAELEKTNASTQSTATSLTREKASKYLAARKSYLSSESAELKDAKLQSNSGLTKGQQACIDDVFARAGKPSVALQRQIDEIRAVKTEDELTKLFLRDAEVVRPTIEAELLSMVLLAKKAELKVMEK